MVKIKKSEPEFHLKNVKTNFIWPKNAKFYPFFVRKSKIYLSHQPTKSLIINELRCPKHYNNPTKFYLVKIAKDKKYM